MEAPCPGIHVGGELGGVSTRTGSTGTSPHGLLGGAGRGSMVVARWLPSSGLPEGAMRSQEGHMVSVVGGGARMYMCGPGGASSLSARRSCTSLMATSRHVHRQLLPGQSLHR